MKKKKKMMMMMGRSEIPPSLWTMDYGLWVWVWTTELTVNDGSLTERITQHVCLESGY